MGNLSKIVLDDETLEVEDTKARTDIGDVATLKTSAKDTLVKAVNECFQSASDGKIAVANAITGKGVATSADATFATMANNISAIKVGIETSDATALEGDVLSGKTYYKDNVKKTGTMPNRTGKTEDWCNYSSVSVQALPADVSQAIVKVPNAYGRQGYYDSSSTVTCNIANLNAGNIKAGVLVGKYGGDTTNNIKGTFTSDANATAGEILVGKTAYVNGAKVTGTMPNRGNANVQTDSILLQNSNVYFNIPNAGYYLNGSDVYAPYSSLASSIGLTSDKIVSGNTVLGVTGAGSSGKGYIKIENPYGGYLSPNYSQSGKVISSSSWTTYLRSSTANYRVLEYGWSSLIPNITWIPSAMKVTQVKHSGSWTGTVAYTRIAVITAETKVVLWAMEPNPQHYSRLMYVWVGDTDTPATVINSNGFVLPLCAQAGEMDYMSTTYELWE